MAKIWITNGIISKLILQDQEISQGWYRGRPPRAKFAGYKHKKKRVYIDIAKYKAERRAAQTLLWSSKDYRDNQINKHTGKESPRKGLPGQRLSDESKKRISVKVTEIKLALWKSLKTQDEFDRGTNMYTEWQAAVFEKDSFICQECKITLEQLGKSFHAHHIKSWEGYPELRYELSNGITLCPSCHRIVEERERAFAIIRIVRQVALAVSELSASYGITEDPDENIINFADASVEELFKVLRINHLIAKSEKAILAQK